MAYRSTNLGALEGADAEAFAQLGIRTVFDLRTEGERSAAPDRLPPGATYVVADVLADSAQLSPTGLFSLLGDPPAATRALGNGFADALYLGYYREFIHLPSARSAYGGLFARLAAAGDRPVLFHCSTGKDRTGWAAAALLMLLGVPDEAVMQDYLLSATLLDRKTRPMLDEFRRRGGDPAVLEPLVGVRPCYLEAAISEMRGAYGDVERYFAVGLGLDAGVQSRLREALIEG